MREAFDRPLGGRARALLEDQPHFLRVLSELPQTLCHHDAARANLFARLAHNGGIETVAIDWEGIGPGSVGADLAALVFGTMRRCEYPSSKASVLDELAFEGYVHGLRDSGWRGEPLLARLGYTAAVAGRWWLMTGALRICTGERARDEVEKEWSRPAATLLGQWIPLTYFMLDCADEARDLAKRLFPGHA